MNTAAAVLEALRAIDPVKLAELRSLLSGKGICGQVYLNSRIEWCMRCTEWLAQKSTEWPEFSGDADYPVESSEEYYREANLWHNPKRIRLLEWLIEQAEKEAEQ